MFLRARKQDKTIQNKKKTERKREKKPTPTGCFWEEKKWEKSGEEKYFWERWEMPVFIFAREITFLIPVVGECRWVDQLVYCHQVGVLCRMIMIPYG